MKEKIIVGIIGTGQIGKAHINKYQTIPDVNIAAVCDINQTEAKKVAEEYNIPMVFSDFRELLKVKEIDAVDICLHNNLHAPVAITAMEAGKDVYCEKPLAGSYIDALKMVETSKKTGRKLSMQLHSLFTNETVAAKKIIEENLPGRIYYVKSSFYRRRGRPFIDGYGTSSFVKKEIAAGGALLDMGVYHICQVLYLIGNPEVVSISGKTFQETPMYEDRKMISGYNVEEFAVGLVRFKGDILFFIEEAWAINLGNAEGIKIAGSKGGLTLYPFTFHTTLADMELNASFDIEGARTRWNRIDPLQSGYESPQHHWIAALKETIPLIDTAELGLNMMLISEGIYLSNKLGREVSVEEIKRSSVSTAQSL